MVAALVDDSGKDDGSGINTITPSHHYHAHHHPRQHHPQLPSPYPEVDLWPSWQYTCYAGGSGREDSGDDDRGDSSFPPTTAINHHCHYHTRLLLLSSLSLSPLFPLKAPTNAPTFSPTTSPTGSPTALPTTSSCRDGVQNGDESDLDCGGACASCAVGQRCVGSGDCGSGDCTSRVCTSFAPTAVPTETPTPVPTIQTCEAGYFYDFDDSLDCRPCPPGTFKSQEVPPHPRLAPLESIVLYHWHFYFSGTIPTVAVPTIPPRPDVSFGTGDGTGCLGCCGAGVPLWVVRLPATGFVLLVPGPLLKL